MPMDGILERRKITLHTEQGETMSTTFVVSTADQKQVVNLTPRIQTMINQSGFSNGLCGVFLPHTTAALTTGEMGEGTEDDLLRVVEKIIPPIKFQHAHDPSHAWTHMASSILGPSLTIPVSEGALQLGTWQSILLVELDGPRQRNIHLTLVPSL